MRNFQDTFETREQSFISVFSICMTVPLINIENMQTLILMRIKINNQSTNVIFTDKKMIKS